MNIDSMTIKALASFLFEQAAKSSRERVRIHPSYIYTGKSKTFKKNKRKGL